MDRNVQSPQQRGRPVSVVEAAHANEYFEQFVNATSLKHILGYYRGLIESLHLKPNVFSHFYPKLRANLTSWRAKALLKKLDARASHKCYQKGKACPNTRVLIIGGGPCGMRTAVEAQLLGAKVVVVEKRDRFSRNNVLHLWPFVIEDLRMLGAKKFFGKFCAGAIDHISIRQLQCIMLKVALLVGVEVHTEVSFEKLVEPDVQNKTGWRAEFKPADHPVSHYEFDVVIGADGKRNTLQGFKRKEFRGKLAIAITANFINKKTEAEARVEEISGVAFIFNQKFFKELQEETRIDLENIVYYKDDTHYFVMTAKKASLIEKGVILQDLADTEKLLAPENVNREALQQYAIEAANFSTNYQMPDLEFAVNHYGQPDIAMFDFTSMYAAENASKVVERNGYRLLMILVGDSLLEPFWPTGSGCARGFLSSLDAAWAIRSWSLGTCTPLDVIAERESIYRLLAQTTPDNLNKDWKSYTLDPTTRYPNLNKTVVLPQQVVYLFDTDNPASIERMKRNAPERLNEVPKKRKRGNVDNEVLVNWLTEQLRDETGIEITDIGSIFKGGKALCAIVHHYRPDLLDYSAIKNEEAAKNNQLAVDTLEKELGIPPVMTGEEITNTEDYLTMATYLTEVYNTFRGEIPHVKHPKLELPESTKMSDFSYKTIKTSNFHPITSSVGGQQSRPSSRHKRHAEPMTGKANSIDKKTRKRRTLEKVGASVEERQKVLQEIASNRAERHNRRRQHRRFQTEQFIKSMQMLEANARPDGQPFEDYSIFLYRQTAPKFEDRVKDLEKQFTYIPDYDNKGVGQSFRPGGTDDDLAARIKSLENKWRDPQPVDKKPKDLLRAIGKIETSDWNIKEIEKKIMENKLGKPSKTFDKEKVPKWSKEQFLARQTKMERQHYDRQDSGEAKYAHIDKSIKNLDQKLREGTARQLGQNKVASITEKLVNKVSVEPKPPEKNVIARPPVILPTQGGSEFCHFCQKRVYLMERLSAEGRFFHHGCFKCQFCNSQLRLGSYSFDRDGMYGYKFFCQNHFGMTAEPIKTIGKPKLTVDIEKSSEKRLTSIAGVDLLDRVQTPERIGFANLSTGHASSDQEESLSQMDEDEWTDKNFGASCAEVGDSDDDSSSLSDTDSDDEDAFDDALEEPVTKEGTMKWAERWKNSYSRKRHDSDSDGYSSSDQWSYENSSDDDNADTATEGEEEIRARELRRQEVRVEPPVVHTDTGTDTEVVSDESSESSSEIHNSATEISTDSEFAQDDPTPTREVPAIMLNDFHVTKTRGGGGHHATPKRIQVTTGYLPRPSNGRPKKPTIELNLKPLVTPAQIVKKPATVLLPRTEGYALNRTQSTGGIAAKVSLELKKKYLLGEAAPGNIQKSGSASTLDTKFKTFHTNISDCQKLLKPAPEISASMQTFCNKLNERKSPVLSPQSSLIFGKNIMDSSKEEQSSEQVKNETKSEEFIFENESEGRPRSPVHETSIIVPQIDWSKKNQSLSSDSLATSSSENDVASKPKFENIPRVEVHTAKDVEEVDDIPLDSLCVLPDTSSLQSETHKSIASEKKSLNQPKTLPSLATMLPEIHNSLHVKFGKTENEVAEIERLKNSSGLSSPESYAEQPTTALTETELSDWARDEVVSDDFEYADFEYDKEEKRNEPSASCKMAKLAELEDLVHVCGRDKSVIEPKIKVEAINTIIGSNLDNIEFMDTGTETSSDDGIVDSQNGYILFKNEDEFAEDSLNPDINEVVEAKNIQLLGSDEFKNTGYCVLASEVMGKVDDLKPSDLEKFKQNQAVNEHEEDSLLIVETGTTTEENTCSDSTVKNVAEIIADKKPSIEQLESENNNQSKETIEALRASTNNEPNKNEHKDSSQTVDSNVEFDEHCQRLQSKVEFGNVKDSIDVRKSRRRNRSDASQKPDLIQEEAAESPPNDVTLKLTPTPHTPDILYRKDIIKKERDVNQKLIQEMVMNKMLSEHKSLERKKRNRSSQSPYELTKSITTDVVSQINLSNLDANRKSTYSTASSTYSTPDVLLSANLIPLQNSKSVNTVPDTKMSNDTPSTPIKEQNRPVSFHAAFSERKSLELKKLPEEAGLSDDTPKAPPRQHRQNDDINRKLEKLKQAVKAKGKENELKVSLESLVANAERRNSWLYSNDVLNKKKNAFKRSKSGEYGSQSKIEDISVPIRTKSIPELPKNIMHVHDIEYETERKKFCRSDPNILESEQKSKKKGKDRERRKSITKMFTSLFTKKSPSSGSKGLFSKLSPRSKDMSKVMEGKVVRRKSVSEVCISRNAVTPPPIPPLPANYTVKGTDESSEGEIEHKTQEHSSCDTLDQSGLVENSMSSLTGRRSSNTKKAIRHAQRSVAKRHRLAQEIQRKLEETEVKTKELEVRGVEVEKAIRGEDGGACSKDECELLQEWFDLMRDRTELRRYERELTVRAQELELEDRHARLQHELRDRLEIDGAKTEEDLKIEKSIIKEMMEIVSQRDSLVSVIEQDRLRCSTEDRNLEDQMLAKGLRLTPIKKSAEK